MLCSVSSSLLALAAFTGLTSSRVIPVNDLSSTSTRQDELQRRQKYDDPTDFTWVSRFAAIGDSYTAGIGAGSILGSLFHRLGDWACSRYDQSYPMLFYHYLGSNVEDFAFPACTGALTADIFDQVKSLEGKFDLVTLTAGGNDLCLVNIVTDCVLLAFHGEETCNKILDKAQENLDNIVRKNVKEILLALNDKMAKDGIVVYNSYARFFNTESDDCAKNQDWGLFRWVYYLKRNIPPDPLPLTIERRKRFNNLTMKLNDLLREVVHEVEDEVDYTIGFSNWDLWPIEGVKGQMCDPSSSGRYPDPDQPDLVFFKLDTRKTWLKWLIKKRDGIEEDGDDDYIGVNTPVGAPAEKRNTSADLGTLDEEKEQQLQALAAAVQPFPPLDVDEEGVDRSIYDSSLWKSVNPRAAVIKKLDPRAPDPPGCPGEGILMKALGLLLPNFLGRVFHPNEDGHNAIASFAILKAIDLRAKVLDLKPQVCEVTDEFKCWQKEGRTAYATADRLDENYKKFCDELEPPDDDRTGWRRTRKFFEGTPDEHEFVVELGENASKYNKKECHESMKRIIHGCDGNDPKNPMNWKFGGRWKRDQYTYEVNPKKDNRPWPLKEPYGSCKGSYHFVYSSYEIKGAGWSSWDYGQKTLLPNSKGCLGLGITKWKFEYFDEPDEDGYEWKSTFRTPIFVNNRCFKNNKVAFASGGFTDGCGGSGWA
ncbi:hypothetical protein VTO42DRAFT_3963 [Malbranchea cinnamomea]